MRLRGIAAALIAIGALAAWVVASASTPQEVVGAYESSEASVKPEYQGARSPASKETDHDRLACTVEDEVPNFDTYTLGAEILEHRLTATIRRCDAPAPPPALRGIVPDDAARANFVSYIYGDCTPSTNFADESSCAPPVEVQVWPACERSLADYSGHSPISGKSIGQIRGVPAWSFEGGNRVELYAGSATIVVFANSPAEVLGAVDELQRQPSQRPLGAASENAQQQDAQLPEPAAGALNGSLSCEA